MGALEALEGLDGQVDQKAQACRVGPQLHYHPSVPAFLVFLVFRWVLDVLLSQIHPWGPFHLSAPTFQEILGNPFHLWGPSHPFHLWIPFLLWIQGSPWSPLVLLTLASPSDPGHLFHPWVLQDLASQWAQACPEHLGGQVYPSFLAGQILPFLPWVLSCQEAPVDPGGQGAQGSRASPAGMGTVKSRVPRGDSSCLGREVDFGLL